MKVKIFLNFIFVIFCIYLLLDFERNQKIESFLDKQTELFSKLYKVHYNNYKQTSKMIFDSIIDQKKIFKIYGSLEDANKQEKDILRAELYDFLKEKYEKFRYTSLKQLHFHLKNSESFLRMHKPGKFGDNLSNVREGVVYVNKHHKAADGFEMGRVYSGLRFVYPLIDNNNKHLGSVEISFDISIFTSQFMENFKVLSDFHLNGKILEQKAWKESIKENYINSYIKGFYLEKKNTEVLRSFAKKLNLPLESPDQEIIEKALELISNKKTVSIYDKKSDSVITFLPLANKITGEVSAFFTIINHESYINSKNKNFYFLFGLLTLFAGLIFYLFFKEFNIKDRLNKELHQKVEEETAEMKKQKNFFDTLIQTSPIPFFYKDIEGNYTNVNQKWCDFTGFAKEEIIGKSVYDVAPKKIADIYYSQDQKVFNLEENPQIYESKILNKNNDKEFDVMFYKSAFINSQGKVEGIIGYLIDMTEIKQLQEDAVNKEKIFFEQSKLASMGEMIGNIAHQWRQPLSVISTSATGMLAKKTYSKLTDEDLVSYCNSINNNAQYLSETIDDFRNFIKENKLKKEFEFKENIKHFLSLVSGSVKSNDIDIHSNVENGLKFKGYPNELIQCYMNIYNNSKDAFIINQIKHRLFFIDCFKKGNKIIITFKDNAGGIPKNMLSKVFEPYFTSKHQSLGTGLGLYMTRNLIVESMNGNITAENVSYSYGSDNYDGALFTIELPVVIPEDQ
jgi:PAS domain S-box-containing protein